MSTRRKERRSRQRSRRCIKTSPPFARKDTKRKRKKEKRERERENQTIRDRAPGLGQFIIGKFARVASNGEKSWKNVLVVAPAPPRSSSRGTSSPSRAVFFAPNTRERTHKDQQTVTNFEDANRHTTHDFFVRFLLTGQMPLGF